MLAVTVISAVLVVTLKNIFHSALALALTLIGIACIYLYLNCEFLAIRQLLLYVGAILTLILFAIMLIARINDKYVKQSNEQKGISFILCGSLFVLIVIAISKLAFKDTLVKGYTTFQDIGKAVLTQYALPFEFVSIVLLASLIGAIALASRTKDGDQ